MHVQVEHVLPGGAYPLARLVNHPYCLTLRFLRHRLEVGGPGEEHQEGGRQNHADSCLLFFLIDGDPPG